MADGNDLRKIGQMLADGRLTAIGGTISNVTIEHDDWCALLVGGMSCDCDPDVSPGLPVNGTLAVETITVPASDAKPEDS